ncbi:MAG: metal-dependent hydrolase [Schwartzia sp. (in: firmicutes)]
MKWISHQIVTGAVVYLATDSLLLTACSMAGAVIPDRLEGDPRRAKNYWLWRRMHRGLSHWPGLYLFAIALCLSLRPAADDGTMCLIAVMVGALLHILEDALCGKVPLIFPGEKIGLKLFSVGSFTEYFFAAGIVLLAYGLRLFRGG